MRAIGLLIQAFVVVLLSIGAVAFLGFTIVSRFAESPAPVAAQTVLFTIPPGTTTSDIGRALQRDGLIRSDLLFRLLVDRRGLDGRLRQGVYLLRQDMSLDEILTLLEAGQPAEQTVTFPEGFRIEEMADRLDEQTHIAGQDFLGIARNQVAELANEFPFLRGIPPGVSLEGYLFPDTYQINAGTTAGDLVRTMLRRFDDIVTVDMRSSAAARGWDLHALITVASVVEREARIDEEYALVAGVFANRLATGIPLQADPTVQYALGRTDGGRGWWKPDLTTADFRVDSLYNTYLHSGLMPGPIANPGLKSIAAAANPAETPYIFFVAKGDGSHAFSVTLEEHERNIAQYRALP
ncbi:MAG: endolytic transglycosylase MltG [Chloroflexi bacterium]|nr:endolytic transglycosylase MltG [Chloroflexota bacterium]